VLLLIDHDGGGFAGLPNPFEALRYHSLAIVPETMPEALEVCARAESGVIWASGTDGVRSRVSWGLLIW
jgi:anthranilate/para-aminobenzoate synthase component II